MTDFRFGDLPDFDEGTPAPFQVVPSAFLRRDAPKTSA